MIRARHGDHVDVSETPGAQMAAEMAQQPAVLGALAGRLDETTALVRGIVPAALAGTIVLARGSSDHAGAYGRYLIELTSRRPVALAAPSLHTLYGAEVDCSGYLAVAVSQSGRTPEIVTTLERMQAAGAAGLAVTNDADSPLAGAAAAALALGAGEERAVPATKTVTATLAAFAMIAGALGPAPFDGDALGRVPGWVEEVLADAAPAQRVAEGLAECTRLVAVGRGLLYGAALEAALKLKETTMLSAEGFSSADLRHGPIAVVEHGFPVLAFLADGPAHADMADLVRGLRGRGAQVFVAAQDPGADLSLPAAMPEALVPIAAVVRAQQVALALARLKGLDADRPAGLSKVTVT
jgi:glucosamine--fructose-6-phosphate aminotransferase (isomerizing)